MLKYLLLLLLLVSGVSLVFGCRCPVLDEKKGYCKADYAFIARVHRDEDASTHTQTERVYKIKVLRNFKPQVPDNSVIRNKVYTALSSGACGVLLDEGGIYLLAGQYSSAGYGRIKQYIGLCTYHRKLTKSESKVYSPPSC